MRVCIPVNEDQGLDSSVCAHFGSAPLFMIVDQESGACRAIVNTNQHHAHGMCQPLAVLAGESFDGIVVGGIGAGALARLERSGIRVYQTRHASVRETVAAVASGTLPVMTTQMTCAGHGHHK